MEDRRNNIFRGRGDRGEVVPRVRRKISCLIKKEVVVQFLLSEIKNDRGCFKSVSFGVVYYAATVAGTDLGVWTWVLLNLKPALAPPHPHPTMLFPPLGLLCGSLKYMQMRILFLEGNLPSTVLLGAKGGGGRAFPLCSRAQVRTYGPQGAGSGHLAGRCQPVPRAGDKPCGGAGKPVPSSGICFELCIC